MSDRHRDRVSLNMRVLIGCWGHHCQAVDSSTCRKSSIQSSSIHSTWQEESRCFESCVLFKVWLRHGVSTSFAPRGLDRAGGGRIPPCPRLYSGRNSESQPVLSTCMPSRGSIGQTARHPWASESPVPKKGMRMALGHHPLGPVSVI